MRVFQYNCYSSTPASIQGVVKQMEELDQELKETDLENLIAFNHTYLIITRAVVKRLGKKYFQDDLLMQRIDVTFARYYFDALKDYVDEKKIDPAWKVCFDSCKKNQSYQWVYMALGVNAHVNHDLAFTLRDVHERNKYDYFLINSVISKNTKSVVFSLYERSRLVNTAKNKLFPVYIYILDLFIRKWRKRAWDNSLLLVDEMKIDNRIAIRAAKIASYFTYIRRIKTLLT